MDVGIGVRHDNRRVGGNHELAAPTDVIVHQYNKLDLPRGRDPVRADAELASQFGRRPVTHPPLAWVEPRPPSSSPDHLGDPKRPIPVPQARTGDSSGPRQPQPAQLERIELHDAFGLRQEPERRDISGPPDDDITNAIFDNVVAD